MCLSTSKAERKLKEKMTDIVVSSDEEKSEIWAGRRRAVIRQREHVRRLRTLEAVAPRAYRKDLQEHCSILARMIEVYEELDDERLRLLAQLEQLEQLEQEESPKAAPRARAKKRVKA